MKNFLSLFLLIVFFSCAIAQVDKPVNSEQELWLEYMKAYSLKKDMRKEYLVRKYPDWSEQYAKRLMTGYLSFFLKDDDTVAQKNLNVLKSIAQMHNQLFGNTLLMQQASFYEALPKEKKRLALEAIMLAYQAKMTNNAMYLFSVEPTHQSALDNNQITEEIKKQFEENKRPLSSLAIIEAKDKGKEWLINDKGGNPDKKYLLLPYKEKVVVYHIELYQRALKICHSIQDEYSIAEIFNSLGFLSHSQGRLNDATIYFKQAMEYYIKFKDNLNVSKNLNSLGLLAYSEKEYTKAHSFYKQAMEYANKTENYTARATILNNLGALHKSWSKYDDAEKYFEESLNYYTMLKDQAGLSTSLNNLGAILLEKKQYKKAKDYLEKSLSMSRNLGDDGGVAQTLNLLSDYYLSQKDYKSSQKCLEESLKIGQKMRSVAMVESSLQEIEKLQRQKYPAANMDPNKLDILKIMDDAVEISSHQRESARLDKVDSIQSRDAQYKRVLMIMMALMVFISASIVGLWLYTKSKNK